VKLIINIRRDKLFKTKVTRKKKCEEVDMKLLFHFLPASFEIDMPDYI
jgi:hypothetical protein